MFVRSTSLAAAAVAAGLLTLGLAAAPAVAQPAETVLVSYADLNLASQLGRERLDRRIASAAEQLCGGYSPVELQLGRRGPRLPVETIADTLPQRDAAIGLRGTVRVSSADRVLRVSRAAN